MELGPLRLRTFAATAFSIWTLLAFISWHTESSCGAIFVCGAEIWDTVRWVVLLKWVKEYQEALGGGATLLAAVIAYRAVQEQIRQSAEREAEIQKSRVRKTINWAATEFNIAASAIYKGTDQIWIDQGAWRKSVVSDIAEFDPELVEVFRYAETLIDVDYITIKSLLTPPPAVKLAQANASAKAYAACLIFLQAGRLLNNKPGSLIGFFDGKDLDVFLRSRGLTRSSLLDLRNYFK